LIRSEVLWRIAKLPENLRRILIEDIAGAIENRVETMERLAAKEQ